MSRKSSAIALLAAVFFAGVATTLAVLRVVDHRGGPGRAWERGTVWQGERPPRPSARPGDFPRGGSPFMELARTRVTDRMARVLELSDEQRTRIEDAFERRRISSQEAMNEVLPRLRSQMDSVNAEIERILTPEQRDAYRRFLREDRERFRRRGGSSRDRDRTRW